VYSCQAQQSGRFMFVSTYMDRNQLFDRYPLILEFHRNVYKLESNCFVFNRDLYMSAFARLSLFTLKYKTVRRNFIIMYGMFVPGIY
jgi:hypothetical protein